MYRSEQKFLVDESTLQIMQNKLAPLLQFDSNQKGDSYRIRSMYFDTYERKSYRENDAGVEERKKYRIRVYDHPKSYIRLEIKHKLKDRNYKESCQLTISKFEEIMDRTLKFSPEDPRPLRMLYLDMQMNLLRPSVIFLNGEYFGIHNIRERQDEYYLQSHYDVDENDIVILEQNGSLYRGSNSDIYHYQNILQYIEENGLENDDNFDYIQTLMDTENYRDYFASEVYFGNADWPHNNIRFWRKTTDSFEPDAPYGHDGRWRWMLFDTDHGFYRSDEPFGDKNYPLNHQHNTIDWVMGEYDGRRGTQKWPNFLFRSMMSNENFKNDFLNRMNDLFNSNFSEEVVSDQIDTFVQGIQNEILYQIDRWGAIESMEEWEMYLDRKYLFANERPDIMREYLMEEFNIEDTITVNVRNESNEGYVRLNTIDINEELPGNTGADIWSGTYFTGIPITVEAVAKDGYEFSHWEGLDAQEESVEVTPATDLNLRAVFIQE